MPRWPCRRASPSWHSEWRRSGRSCRSSPCLSRGFRPSGSLPSPSARGHTPASAARSSGACLKVRRTPARPCRPDRTACNTRPASGSPQRHPAARRRPAARSAPRLPGRPAADTSAPDSTAPSHFSARPQPPASAVRAHPGDRLAFPASPPAPDGLSRSKGRARSIYGAPLPPPERSCRRFRPAVAGAARTPCDRPPCSDQLPAHAGSPQALPCGLPWTPRCSTAGHTRRRCCCPAPVPLWPVPLHGPEPCPQAGGCRDRCAPSHCWVRASPHGSAPHTPASATPSSGRSTPAGNAPRRSFYQSGSHSKTGCSPLCTCRP